MTGPKFTWIKMTLISYHIKPTAMNAYKILPEIGVRINGNFEDNLGIKNEFK